MHSNPWNSGIFFAILVLAMTRDLPGQTAGPANDLAARRQGLNQLLDEQWQYTLRETPELATIIGDYRYNDRFSDASLAHVDKQRRDNEAFLKRFEAIDTTGFPEQEALNQQLMVRNLKDTLTAISLKLYLMPVDQFGGIHLQLAQFVPLIPFNTTKQYEDYVARLHQIPRLLDQTTEVLEQGRRDGLMPPRFLLEKVITQIKAIAEPSGEANVFGQPAEKFPDAVPAADQKRIREEVLKAVNTEVRPAYTKLANFVSADYAQFGRTEPGIWALPNGTALYQFAIRQQTTTNMDAAAIHELGLREVDRIHAEMLNIAKLEGFSDRKSFQESLKTNPKLIPASREDILNTYRGYIAGMQPELPKLFGLLPKTKVEVRPVQEYREKEAAAAEYNQGTPDGSRPGIVYVNTGDYTHRSKLSIESTAYHEAIPGHHMQIAIAQTLPGLPPFRQQSFYTAYVEGWALYAERLGKDVGFYKDPLSDYGRLSDELLRACRLVLDTGVHYKHWTREQMIAYFRANSGEDEPDIQAETDRYIVMPGQALAYKIGQLKILELRARAQKELGAKYDIRAFHDEILNGGALPLDVLEARVNAWIQTVKTGKDTART
ncbi:MAG TPA: DUF885 domain-containing protein [Bryobacteraceae bacterium]|jgi:uncharacterized protein (DUF885 family)|nr:DUF885 domain-containing protein [Bryobacteraceae bacterium]